MNVQVTGAAFNHHRAVLLCGCTGGFRGTDAEGDRSWKEDVHPCREPAFSPQAGCCWCDSREAARLLKGVSKTGLDLGCSVI